MSIHSSGGLAILLLVSFFPTPTCFSDSPIDESHPHRSPSQWPSIFQDIHRMEYEITWQEKTSDPGSGPAYHLANRAQDLRAYFFPDRFRMRNRTDLHSDWSLDCCFTGLGRIGNSIAAAPANVSVEKNRLRYTRDRCDEVFTNSQEGIQLSMTLQSPPAGSGPLELTFEMDTDLECAVCEGASTVEFCRDGVEILWCELLRVLDTNGRSIPTTLKSSDGRLVVICEDQGAPYPMTIDLLFKGAAKDGLSLSANTTLAANVEDASFGYSVATAGDVNGDGYSDVIVGAPDFDGGTAGEGRAFVYHGTPFGVDTSDFWFAEIDSTNARFGISVATAGDVDGDGFSDVLIGAEGFAVGNGAVFLWKGSDTGLGENGTRTNADWSAYGNQSASYFGCSVASAGDLNGDRFSDLIVGAKHLTRGEAYEGAVFVWYGSAEGPAGPSSLLDEADWIFEGDHEGAFLGTSVATAGDVDGDGYSDIIVGAPGVDYTEYDTGRCFVFYGSETGLNSLDLDTFHGIETRGQMGFSVATAGDVNGDGFSDVIVGVPFYDSENPISHSLVPDSGQAQIYHGSGGGISTSPNLRIDGIDEEGLFGSSVSTAGDINGDGYADVIVGAPGVFRVGPNSGHVEVYLGSSDGVGESLHWSNSSYQTDAEFGTCVATAGDVNGDGYSDVIIGAPGFSHESTQGGRVSIYHGSPMALNIESEWSRGSGQAGSWYGASVGTAGDVNGDGYADVIIGANGYDNGQENEGRVFVYHGSATGLQTSAAWRAESDQQGAQFGLSAGTAGDFNGDGYSDVIVGAYFYDIGDATNQGRAFIWYGSETGLGENGTPANADWTYEGDQQGEWLGASVRTAGDVNGDRFSDVLIGAPKHDHGELDSGLAVLAFGASEGSIHAEQRLYGEHANAFFGTSVATAGDVNGDGYADIIVGAPGFGNGETAEGGAFVYHGSASGVASVPDWTAESNQENAQMGISVGSAGDVNGDSYADVIVGVYLYDILIGPYAGEDHGRAFLWYGGPSPIGLGPNGTLENEDWSGGTFNLHSWCGFSVGTAGDVNGDGYADVVVGAPHEGPFESKKGHAYVFLGSSVGPGGSEWMDIGDQDEAYFGASVGSAGDVNGDGCADILVGSYLYDVDSSMNEGQAFLYYGNNGRGPSLNPRQRLGDDSGPVADGGWLDSENLLLALRGRTPFGRGLAKMESEVKPFGVPFDGLGTFQTTDWLEAGLAGAELSQLVQGLAQNTSYHWRVRVLYHPANFPLQPHGQWITMPWKGWEEADFRTGGSVETPTPRITETPTMTPTATPGPRYSRIEHLFLDSLGYHNFSTDNLGAKQLLRCLEEWENLEGTLLTRGEYLDLIGP